MDENNTYINKSEKEALEIMENVSDITSDQLQALRENEECFQTCSDIVQSPNQKIPDRKTKCVIKTHINIKQNVIFGAKLKPV